jgi:hypothetical protein
MYKFLLIACGWSMSAQAQFFNSAAWHVPVPISTSWVPQAGSLVGLWNFDSDFTSTVGTSMTASGGSPTIAANPAVGLGCAYLNGTSWISTPSAATYAFADTTFTVAFWIKTSNTSSWAVSNGGGTSSGLKGGWSLGVSTGKAQLFLKDSSNNQAQLIGSNTVNDGKWHHVVFVITTNTITGTSNTATIYTDGGNPSSSMNYGTFTEYYSPGTSYGIGLGGRFLPTAGSTATFSGYVDELAIWSTGLTAAEVKKLYISQSAN